MSDHPNLGIIILAAGKGKRMKSTLPKVLHQVVGIPMIKHVVTTASQLNPEKVVIVVGQGKEQVKDVLKGFDLVFVEQREQLGTGHAVTQAEKEFAGFNGNILILSGDVPLITQMTLDKLLQMHYVSSVAATVLSAIFENPFGYGRIILNGEGSLDRIVEEKDCTTELQTIQEVNAGIYVFDSQLLFLHLSNIVCDNRQKEYYLPDIIPLLRKSGHRVAIEQVNNIHEVAGVNTREQLIEINRILE
ncbi:MAG: NTP transferase domain-containing protein [Candidatus Marinimicrobia bacterium]|nr:NTP transferase domain-containing protein [Candidatus Neomarinimicrobiota bacterium]